MTKLIRLPLIALILCICASKTQGVNPDFEFLENTQSELPLRRLEETLPCDDIVATWSLETLMELTNNVINRTFEGSEVVILQGALLSVMKYGVQIRKICSSCKEMGMHEEEMHKEYCTTNNYGYNLTQSGLLLLPIDADTGSIHQGTMPAVLYNHPSVLREAPTVWFGEDSNILLFLNLVVASTGVINIMPDYLGYGGYDDAGFWDNIAYKAYLIKKGYQTSIMPLWYKTAQIIQRDSKCASALGNAVSIFGYSEGGYVSVAMADTMYKAGINVVHVDAGGAPIDLETTVYMMVKTVDNSEFPVGQRYFLALIGNSFSSTYPDIPSYQKQNMLNSTSKEVIRAILFNSTEPNSTGVRDQIFQAVPEGDLLSIVDLNSLALIRSYIVQGLETSHPCNATAVVGENDLLCQAFIENTLTESVLTAQYPIRFCHSQDDKVVHIANVPADLSGNPNLEFIAATGDHSEAGQYCLLQALIYLTRSGIANTDMSKVSTGLCDDQTLPGAPNSASTIPSPISQPTNSVPQVATTNAPLESSSSIPVSPSSPAIPLAPTLTPTSRTSEGSRQRNTWLWTGVVLGVSSLAVLVVYVKVTRFRRTATR